MNNDKWGPILSIKGWAAKYGINHNTAYKAHQRYKYKNGERVGTKLNENYWILSEEEWLIIYEYLKNGRGKYAHTDS